MIDGNLIDVSLPGLLQFLANESDKIYKITVRSKSHEGLIFVSSGSVVAATFGLLNGEDALCEFLSWTEGTFSIERLWDDDQIEKNINLRMEHSSVFVSHCADLAESTFGLNTVIVTSKTFGSADWQDEVRKCPLERMDFSVAAWLGHGRTMRQAMREFSLDLVTATGILYRLLLTKSIEKVRPGAKEKTAESETTSDTKIATEPRPVAASALARAGRSAAEELEAVTIGSIKQDYVPFSEERNGATKSEEEESSDQSHVQRTDAMPIITLDIERLLQATFAVTDFGRLSLKNAALDPGRRQTLEEVDAGKSVIAMVNEAKRPSPAILFNIRYCLDRGYIEADDPVLPLTVDLLLRQMEIDQYLLQRRRVTGDELRDLVQISREEGVKLPELLMRSGYLTVGDIETIEREQQRFAPR